MMPDVGVGESEARSHADALLIVLGGVVTMRSDKRICSNALRCDARSDTLYRFGGTGAFYRRKRVFCRQTTTCTGKISPDLRAAYHSRSREDVRWRRMVLMRAYTALLAFQRSGNSITSCIWWRDHWHEWAEKRHGR